MTTDAIVRHKCHDGRLIEAPLDLVQVDDLAGTTPIREFRSYRGRKHYSGWYWSATMNAHVAYESLLEKSRLCLADHAPDVVAIAAQPFELRFTYEGRERKRIPDFFLLHRDRHVTVVDVKPAHRLADTKVVAAFAATRAAVQRRGWDYEVWSGEDPTVMANIDFLAGYRRIHTIDPDALDLVRDRHLDGDTIRSLFLRICAEAPSIFVIPAALHLLWTGEWCCRLDQPLSRDTPTFKSADQ